MILAWDLQGYSQGVSRGQTLEGAPRAAGQTLKIAHSHDEQLTQLLAQGFTTLTFLRAG